MVDLTPEEARRVVVILAQALIDNGRTGGWWEKSTQVIVRKLMPACDWENADSLGAAMAIGALHDAGVL